jgi:uncharacterized protein (TIGR02246 family)
MRRNRTAAIAAALLLATPGIAAAAEADVVREAQDRAEIAELMWTYVRAIDSLDEDAYAAVFTPDGAFLAGPNPTRGHEALRKMVADLEKSQADRRAKGESIPAMHHVMSNEHIAFIDRDRARIHYYWMTVFAGAPNTQPPRVAAAGRGVDELVRVDGKWLIQTRNVTPQD